jgi:hypothetical protein
MPKGVIAIIKGGLGNQLFIYAAARALGLRTGRELFLDIERGYTHDGYGRSYRLDHFPTMAKVMPEAWRVAPHLKHPSHKALRTFNKFLPHSWRTYYAERRNLSATQLTTLTPKRERITLVGYWQDEAYFSDYAEAIWQELQPPAPSDARNRALGHELLTSESVFLHIRRLRYPNRLDAAYYQRAVDEALQYCNRPKFVILGDDPVWATQQVNFHGAACEVITHNGEDELADLWLMTRCRHAIVANSSFSWWGAWLGEKQRKVWAPAHPGLALKMSKQWRALENRIKPEPLS